MFRYQKDKHLVKIYCPNCKTEQEILIPDSMYQKKDQHYPLTFRYVHGNPVHSITFYIDANGDIRGHEFGDTIHLSNDIIQNLFNQRNLSSESETSQIIKTMFNTFTTFIDTRIPQGQSMLYEIGVLLGENLATLFKSEEKETLLDELSKFWSKNTFGKIDEIKIESQKVEFNVYDCFECSHMPNIGRPVCKLDEGFIKTVFKKRLKRSYIVSEKECYATGNDHCRFEIYEEKN